MDEEMVVRRVAAKFDVVEQLRKLLADGWFALGAIGNGFPSAAARRLLGMGYLERKNAPSGVSRLWDYQMTKSGVELRDKK